MKRKFSGFAFVFWLAALPCFAQGSPGQSNYPVTMYTSIGAPSGTCPGTNILDLNVSNGNVYSCPVAGGSWVLGGGSSFPVTGNVTVNTGGSLTPSGIGQVVDNQTWIPAGIGSGVSNVVGLSVTVTASGGSLNNATKFIVAWFNSAAGSTYPSYQAAPSMAACSSPDCSITIAEPAPVPSGMTSWSVADSITSGANYLTNSACTNVPIATTSCTITANGAGAAAPTANTAFTQPPNVQANECPLGVIPSIFTQDMSGDWHTAGGVDLNSNNSITSGYMIFCRHMRFTDQQIEPPSGNNAAWLFNHMAGVGVSNANQDRNVWMNTQTPVNDSASRYGIENLQLETDFNCNGCSFAAEPDADVEVISAQLSDNMQTNPDPAGGIQVARFNYDRTATAAAFQSGTAAVVATFGPGSTTGFGGGSIGYVYQGSCLNTSGSIPNLTCIGYDFVGPANADHFGNGAIAFAWTKTLGFVPVLGTDFFLQNQIVGAESQLNGPVTLSQVVNNYSNTTLPITGAAVVTSSLTVSQGAMEPPSAVSCSGGSSSYSYEFVGVDNNGGQVAGIAQSSTSTCDNPLTSGNPATVGTSLTSVQIVAFVRIDVYRTGGPMATGKVGSLTCTTGTTGGATCSAFTDTGLSASGAVPTINTTGSVQGYKLQTNTECAANGTAASTSVVSCAAAPAGSFSCATNASGLLCDVNTTAVTASSQIFVTLTAAKSSLLSVTCNPGGATLTILPSIPIASQTAGTGFVINMPTITSDPVCYDFQIVN